MLRLVEIQAQVCLGHAPRLADAARVEPDEVGLLAGETSQEHLGCLEGGGGLVKELVKVRLHPSSSFLRTTEDVNVGKGARRRGVADADSLVRFSLAAVRNTHHLERRAIPDPDETSPEVP